MEYHKQLLTYLFLAILAVLVHSQQNTAQPSCLGRSCYPATGNLLVGREDNLQASSTCGLTGPERYCVVGDVRDVKKCFTCDSRSPWSESNPNSHNITNIVTTFSKDRWRRWWQAENGKENANIQLDLDAEFHFTHLIITFKTFRPKAMYIERSFDFGKSWLPYRYFAEDCKKSFPYVPRGPIQSLKYPTICEETYSNVLPASGGEVVFKVLPPHVKIDDPYSPEVQDLLKLTNLRIIFKELHTLGDDLLDLKREINEKYYYSILDMVVRGSCSCYGHASRCVPSDEDDWQVENMVHSKCECTHNTKGKNCDQCADFYNDIPWTPARGKNTGECRKCECHDHATSCHFDPAVYHSRGNASGGVCDNCMHNTDGLNCELCKSHFYQDPARDLRDPNICQPCDCEPIGTQNNGECDMRNDPANGLVAGKCKCKQNVGGTRCERCLTGYWNLTENGCIECECNTLGTYGNLGCNQYSGHCTCKRNVVGRNCDQCLDTYWGLSSSPEGCQECGCDIGGSFDNYCDVVSGQCRCKPGITGRACDQAISGYFVTDLDYLRYEAETATAIGTGTTQAVIRERVPSVPITWTGPGFMRVFEKAGIEFEINNIPHSMNYDIIIRYETQMPHGWDDVRVRITRPNSPDPDGPCGNTRPEDDYPGATLSAEKKHYVVRPQICFEAGKTYFVTLDFPHYEVPDDTPEANILIDSIALMPVYTDIPWRLEPNLPINPGQIIFCNNLEYDSHEKRDPNDLCDRYIFSAGTAIQKKALVCDCDTTGSDSNICDPNGGQCKCKPNVSGRRCDQCDPGTYGFGPSGCSFCNCNPQGARDNFCDSLTGQCLCLTNIRGRQCDQCYRGMFNFPYCKHCQCNGHADECEDRTGICINCQDDTKGPLCEECLDGYYGDPSLGSGIPCRKCMCPGGEDSGYQHADTCSLDPRTKEMICDCPSEFAGDRCEKCAINHYGNPLVANGTCTSCLAGCNYNIDPSVPESCNAETGRCLKCQYNTEGDNCELCANGYFGDATAHSCVPCACNWLGSDRNATEQCDRTTGQCPCLPNVIGSSCDQCAVDHWKLASGEGCEHCECDDEGSLSPRCNEFDGQCSCMDGRGGRRCDQCVALHYGDPTKECFPCDCNIDGSETRQCDPYTGQCPCLDGITGKKCDRCDRGTTGTLPHCVPCGQCFDDWDRILKGLKERTDEMIAQVNVTKSEGAVGVYDDKFVAMEKKLAEIDNIIINLNQSEANMTTMDDSLDHIRRMLLDAKEAIETLNRDFGITNRDIDTTENALALLEGQIQDFIDYAETQKKDVEEVLQEDIIGAYNTIKANDKRSQEALDKAIDAKVLVDEALARQNDTLDLLENSREEFEKKNQLNSELLNDKETEVEAIRDFTLTDINKQVCDLKSPFTAGQFCDAACGGGGCNSCGEGDSCTDGAQGKVSSAGTIIKKADTIANNKTLETAAIKNELLDANAKANTTLAASKKTRDVAKKIADDVNSASADTTSIINKIGALLGDDKKTTPDEVIIVADEVLAMSIPPELLQEIEQIARQINDTIQNLTNIDQILNETSADLATSERLKERADNASKAADRILEQVYDLNMKLSAARQAQNDSTDAIENAKESLEDIRNSLKMIGDVMTAAIKKANDLGAFVEALYKRTSTLNFIYTKSAHNLEQAKGHTETAAEHADLSKQYSDEIVSKYTGVSEQIADIHSASKSAKDRADRLLERAKNLAFNLNISYLSLLTMQTELTDNAQKMKDLQKEIDKLTIQMDAHVKRLTDLENHHNKCEFTESTTL